MALPDALAFPEGIAYDPASDAIYTASARDGTVVSLTAATGEARIVVPGGTIMPASETAFPGPLGMALDAAGSRLWIVGGATGKAWVIATADGRVLKEVAVPAGPMSLLNDVAIAGTSAYITDTLAPTLWRLPETNGSIGNLEPWLDLSGTPIAYDVDGPKLNGIVATGDGQKLIVVHMGLGQLSVIDIASKAVTPVATGDADLTMADGLVLDGDLLYVVRQGAQQIVTLRLAPDLSSATVVSTYADGLAWPATAARVGSDLVVVNTQFNVREPDNATRPFTLLRVPVSALQ